MNRICIIILAALLIFSGSSCYTFKDASTEGINTARVEFFQNEAAVVNPSLSQEFTERLRDKILRESNLKLTDQNPDVSFSGVITAYNIQPVAASSTETAAVSRLTITVTVDFVNTLDEKKSWIANFSRYADFNSNVNFSSVEAALVNEINSQLVDDIFNRAFVNW